MPSASEGSSRLKLYIALPLLILLAGCAANQTTSPQKTEQQSELYEGKPIVSFLAKKQAKTPQEAMARGQGALHGGDLDQALFEFIRAFELDPTHTRALSEIGAIHARRNNLNLAALAYRKALSIDANHIPSLQGLGLVRLRQNQFDDALAQLNQAVQLDQKRVSEIHPLLKGDSQSPLDAYNGIGIVLDLQEKHKEAQHYYQQALDIQPRLVKVLNNFGYSLYLEGEWQPAEQRFQQALRLDGSYAQAWRNLGLVLARQGRFMEALNALEQVMSSPEAHNDIGYICMLDGRYAQAERFFRKAINLNPRYYLTAQQNLQQVQRAMNTAIAGMPDE